MLRYAILQLLYSKELTGYDIKKQFDTTLGFCWHAKHSQIYPELHRMQKDELVVVHTELQQGKPNRNVYSITDKGKQELKDWLKTPIEEIKYKDDLLLRIFSVHLINEENVIAILNKAEELHKQRLEEYQYILTRLKENYFVDDKPKASWVIGRFLDLQQGIMHENMYLEWINFSRVQINEHKDLIYPNN